MNSVGARWNVDLARGRGALLKEQSRFAREIRRGMRGLSFVAPKQPVPLRPIFIDSGRLARLHSLTRILIRLIQRACFVRSAGDNARLADLMNYPPEHLALLSDRQAWNKWAASMVRPDIVYSRGKPYFMECNLHSVIGGVVSSSIVGKLFLRSPTAARLMRDGVRIHERNSMEARRLLLLDVARDMGLRRPPRVALVGWEGDVPPPASIRLFTEEADYLSRNGVPTTFVQPQELELRGGRLGIGRRRFDIALRIFLTREYARAGVSMESFRATERANGTLVLTDDLCSLYTNKIVFAWLHEDTPLLRKADREFVRRCIPWTFIVREGPLKQAGGKTVDLPSFLIRRRREFVLKPLRGSGGNGVVIGRDCPEGRWARHIAEAVELGGFVAQRYVSPDLTAVPFLVDGAIREVKVPVVLGPFVFGRHNGGCFARFPLDPGRRVINRAMGAAASVVMTGGRTK